MDSFVQVPPDDPTGKKLDTESLVVGANTVHRERMELAGAAALEIARILNADPAGADYGLVVRQAGLASPQTSTGLVAAVVPGGTGSLDSNQITSGLTGKLFRFEAWSSAPFNVVLQTVLNGAATTIITRSGGPNKDVEWATPHRDFLQQAESATAGFDGFRLLFTNLDTGVAGTDMHGNFYWDEA